MVFIVVIALLALWLWPSNQARFEDVKRKAKKVQKHWPSADCYGPSPDGEWWIQDGRCRACGRKIKVKEPSFAGTCGMEWADERKEREQRARASGE